MRTKQADGSITEECKVCGGSTYVRNKVTQLPEKCEACKGAGVTVIASAGHVVTDESPDLSVPAVSFGGGSPAAIAADSLAVADAPVESVADEVLDITTANATEGETPDPAEVVGVDGVFDKSHVGAPLSVPAKKGRK